MSKPTRRDYDAYNWLPIERWSVGTLLGPRLNQMICCKICDKYIPFKDSESHVSSHVSQKKRYIADDKKKAKAARIEAMRLAREEKKLAGNS
jgi:hypothetical protein